MVLTFLSLAARVTLVLPHCQRLCKVSRPFKASCFQAHTPALSWMTYLSPLATEALTPLLLQFADERLKALSSVQSATEFGYSPASNVLADHAHSR